MGNGKREITTTIIPLTLTDIMHVKLPAKLVDDINKHIDKIINDNKKENRKNRLAGELTAGEQTGLDPDHPDLSLLKNIYLHASMAFYDNFYSQTAGSLHHKDSGQLSNAVRNPKININDMWYNVYKEGDYNPLHNHGTRAWMGLSSFIFLKVPPSVKKASELSKKSKKLGGASGYNDGKTSFIYGTSTVGDFYNWKYPQGRMLEPEVGDMFIFPKWLQHLVYPFRGPGERRSLAANINVWTESEGGL